MTRPCVCVFSAAPLLTVTVEGIAGSPEVHLHAGGQGFWVARLVARLGPAATLCAPFGGEPGDVLRMLVDHDGVGLRAVSMAGANGVYVQDRRDGERTVVVETNQPSLDRHELDDLYTATIGAALESGVCVLTGVPRDDVIPVETFRRLASDLRANGVTVIADLSGAQLRAALEGGIDLLKVSHEELLADGWSTHDDVEHLTGAIDALHDAGAVHAVVSRAEQPALASFGGRRYVVEAPPMEVVDHHGAGDSMTAALAVATARELPFDHALRFAAAAGSLNVTRHGLGSGDPHTIEQLTANVVVRPLD